MLMRRPHPRSHWSRAGAGWGICKAQPGRNQRARGAGPARAAPPSSPAATGPRGRSLTAPGPPGPLEPLGPGNPSERGRAAVGPAWEPRQCRAPAPQDTISSPSVTAAGGGGPLGPRPPAGGRHRPRPGPDNARQEIKPPCSGPGTRGFPAWPTHALGGSTGAMPPGCPQSCSD